VDRLTHTLTNILSSYGWHIPFVAGFALFALALAVANRKGRV
jgi:hypothetical protein